ncbi:MAG: BREX-2 system adenine-specific DNA-methyltransferase PglX [Thermoleophilaceae bacterium]
MRRSSNWHEITASQFAWEREALDHVRGRFPAYAPYAAWSNFEFLDGSGRLFDVDLMVCTPKGVFVVEVKSWPGRVRGDDHTLVWTDPDGRVRQRDHPLRLTNLKAKALKSLVDRTAAARAFTGRVPFFEAAVFLSDPQAPIELTERGRMGTYGRATDDPTLRPGIRDLVAALVDVSSEDHAQLNRGGRSRRVDRPTAAMLVDAMQQAGVRPSNRLRTVGGYRLGELISEGPGFQDFAGQHEAVPSRRRRIRLYAAPQQADDPRRVQLRRAARREHELLEGLHHQGILRPQDYVEHDLGPALVLDAEPDWPTLDQWLAESGERLSLHDRLDVIRQIADAVRYAHSHHLVHRALSPRAILVSPDEDDRQRIRIGDWRTGALTEAEDPDGTIAGTRHLEALADPRSTPFLAPEALTDPEADGVLLDVFSLGAIAYLVLVGRPAVERAEDLAAALRESDGLDLSAAIDGVGRDLRELVRGATAPVVTQRMDNVDLFLMVLDDAEREASAQADVEEQPDPLAAKPGDRLGGRFVLERRLGTGSSATALLARDEQAGQLRVLKVALGPDREQALSDEAAVLGALRHPAIVELHETVRLRDRITLVLQWASKGTLAARLREDGPLSLSLLERFGVDLLEALRQLEREGYLHRDVKPENLGVVPVGKNDELHLVLFDFSLSRADPTAVRAGTPQYLDPFLAERGRFDSAADRYAVAVTLHEMATGRRPGWGDGRTAAEHTTGPAVLATDVLDAAVRQPLAAFFARALERAASDRFDTAEDMLAGWRAVFARVDAPAAPAPAVDARERKRLLEAAEPQTPLAQLAFTTAQVAALERHNIVVVEDLVLLPANELNRLRGIGGRMRREIAAAAGALRSTLGEELLRRGRRGAAGTSTDEAVLQDVLGLDAVVAQLLPARARDVGQLRIQRALLALAPDELGARAPLAGWPAPDVVAVHLGVDVAEVRAALDAAIRRWAKAPAITAVRLSIVKALESLDGVAGADELARRVLATRGALAQDQETRLRLARAVTRAALEVELARDADARITQRRHGLRLLIAARTETAQVLLDDIIALGPRADALAASDPPLAPSAVIDALREHSTVADAAGMRPSRLVELAAQASDGAAVSPRGELYPVGLSALRALSLAQGALVGASSLTIEELARPRRRALPARTTAARPRERARRPAPGSRRAPELARRPGAARGRRLSSERPAARAHRPRQQHLRRPGAHDVGARGRPGPDPGRHRALRPAPDGGPPRRRPARAHRSAQAFRPGARPSPGRAGARGRELRGAARRPRPAYLRRGGDRVGDALGHRRGRPGRPELGDAARAPRRRHRGDGVRAARHLGRRPAPGPRGAGAVPTHGRARAPDGRRSRAAWLVAAARRPRGRRAPDRRRAGGADRQRRAVDPDPPGVGPRRPRAPGGSMIDSAHLLADLQQQVRRLEDDLRVRADADGLVKETVAAEYQAAKDAGRTAMSLTAWQKELLTQGAVAWVLACVFVRFMEDNELVDDVWLSGAGPRRDVARGRRQRHFEQHPHDTDREVLHAAFRAAASFPAVAGLFDEQHNPLWRLPISGDAARGLIELWDRLDDEAAGVQPVHDFTDPERDTRFLGDLYQDLSEDAQKRYALLQTPEFVESFILDRTLTPALAEYGLPAVRMIDPTCGSGHFLIGAFDRLFAGWQEREPSVPAPELAQRALRAVHGVDLNPFAVAIARFRLIVEALNACDVKRLRDAPGWELRLACGDSLLHGPRDGQLAGLGVAVAVPGLEHHFLTEDAGLLEEILRPGYHVVVGNPPYIVARDKALNNAYRDRYPTCKGKYSLAVPFMERFFELARLPDGGGFVGKITGNAFMKREFGSRLIEDFLPTVDVQTLIDAAGAYIPGHGTPTVIVVGRARRPVLSTVRAVMGIRGEPSPPAEPADGLVWRAIVDQVDAPGSESVFVSVEDVERASLAHHPWSLQGGGATSTKRRIEGASTQLLKQAIEPIGFGAITGEDDAFLRNAPGHLPSEHRSKLVVGDMVRDWQIVETHPLLWPYDNGLLAVESPSLTAALWAYRSGLRQRKVFGKTQDQRGLAWTEYVMFIRSRFRTPLTITFAFVATHNHFVLDRGGKVFKQSAPVIKLPEGATEDDHLALLGVLNSSTACFWLKQVSHNKGSTVDQRGARQRTDEFEDFFEFTGTKLAEFPLPEDRPLTLASALDTVVAERGAVLTDVPRLLAEGNAAIVGACARDAELLAQAISLQEESDWVVMRSFGLVPDELPVSGEAAPPLQLGERSFEIVLARRIASGTVESTWFARHGSTPITDLPGRWPDEYRAVVEQRIALIESDRDVALIERPECKRRWSQPSWTQREHAALRSWLLDHLEALPLWERHELVTCAQLADAVADDPRVQLAAQRLTGTVDVDLARLVQELVVGEAVPYLAAHRYKDSGLRTRAEWEQVWELQRQEDAIDALGLPADAAAARKRQEVGEIPVPPKYKPADFRKTDYWRLRGKLDVPKERFVLVPEGSRTGDPSPVVGWAGWDHVTLAFALAGRAALLRGQDGAGEEQLVPLLAGILELLPWVAQWHPEPDAETGEPAARELEDFLVDELGALGLTNDDLRRWRPPATTRGRRPR